MHHNRMRMSEAYLRCSALGTVRSSLRTLAFGNYSHVYSLSRTGTAVSSFLWINIVGRKLESTWSYGNDTTRSAKTAASRWGAGRTRRRSERLVSPIKWSTKSPFCHLELDALCDILELAGSEIKIERGVDEWAHFCDFCTTLSRLKYGVSTVFNAKWWSKN